MMKKLLCSLFVVLAVFLGSHTLLSAQAEAADVWVYSDEYDRNYYIDDNSVRNAGQEISVRVTWVDTDGSSNKYTQNFKHKGRFWAFESKKGWYPVGGTEVYLQIFYGCCDVLGWSHNQPIR